MALRLPSPIFIFIMVAAVAAVGTTNFTEACEEVRNQMIADEPSLGNENRLKCGQEYNPHIPPALSILSSLDTCRQKWPGWQVSRPYPLAQGIGPLVGFLLPAMIFALSIVRDPKFRISRGKQHFNGNIFVSFGWLPLAFILVILDVLLWITTVFNLAGPIIAGVMDEGIKDLRILRKVKEGKLNEQQKRYTLALVLIGTFEPSPGDLAEKVITHISDASTTAIEAQNNLRQLLHNKVSFGKQVGAPVVFYLGAYVYALVDASSKLGDNDTAHAIAFGIWYGVIVLTASSFSAVLGTSTSAALEGVFGSQRNGIQQHPTYEAALPWDRGRCMRRWVGDPTLPAQVRVHESIQQILKSRVNQICAAAVAIVAVAIPCAFALTISYYTPIVGFGCRATTILCYGGCQGILILCWLCYIEDEQMCWVRSIVYCVGGFFLACSTFVSFGGSVMQLLGVYRNCVCKAGLKYWVNRAGGVVEFGTDTLAHRDSAHMWIRVGCGGLGFIALSSALSWWYHESMKAKLAAQIQELK